MRATSSFIIIYFIPELQVIDLLAPILVLRVPGLSRLDSWSESAIEVALRLSLLPEEGLL
jgi:hypothetical protein